ncbi:MAG: Ig-like domain-containing protein [Acidobacteriota bacterium]|nr:Ig-like domain-containing protein [Acidobacteriota bacterium]
MKRLVLGLPLFAVFAACGGGVSPSSPPPTPPRPPRTLTGLEPFAPRTDIRVGQRVGPLIAYGNYDDGTTGTVNAEWTSSNPDVVAIDEDGFAEGVGAGTAVVTGTFEGFSVELDFVVEDPIPRSTRDRPDDISGPQVHFVYAVPSDWEDRNRDRFGEIERSALGIQNWLAQEIGQTLRLDTYEGRPDVSFLRLPFTHQEGDGRAADVVGDILRAAQSLGVRGDKILAIYYEGRVAGACGSAPLFGGGGAVYLGCTDAELGFDEETISTFEVVMVHEFFHVFGAVASCAPNYIEGSHVNDVENDLMFSGVDREPRGGETFIDVGRDDYYGHGRPDCVDVSRSRFLEPAPGAMAGSRTVEVRLPAGDWPLRCELEH